MILNDTLAQQLQHQMHIYIQQLHELETTLQQERKALASRQFADLARITEHKINLLNEVAHFDQSLQQMLNRLLKKPTKAKVSQLIAQYKGTLGNTLQLQWSAIDRIAQHCQRLNEINGKVVAHAQQHYARLMAILRQQDPDSTTYARNGLQAKQCQFGGTLAQA